MTTRLNLTIEEEIVKKSKRYAAKRKTTVSKMVQEFLKRKVENNKGKGKKKSFLEKYAGVLSGKLSDERVKKIKDSFLKEKYGI